MDVFFLILINILSLLLCGILELIIQYRSATKIKYLNKINLKALLLFICLVIISFSFQIMQLIPFLQKFNYYSFVVVDFSKNIQIVVCIILSHFFLTIINYKHHYVSVIFTSFISFIMLVIKVLHNQMPFQEVFLEILSVFPYYSLYALIEVYEKYMMNKFSIPPYFLLFFKGVISLIIVSFISFAFFSPTIRTIFEDEIKNIKIIQVILYVFMTFSLNVFRIQTIFIYTPAYRYVADILSVFYIFAFTFKRNSYSFTNGFLLIICYLLILFGILVYQEVIIINVWEMNLNTQKQINIRADKEQDITLSLLEENENEIGNISAILEDDEKSDNAINN